MKLKQYIQSFFQLSPQKGYDLWAPHYQSGDNLMHVLDRQIVENLLSNIPLRDKKVLDFGCGAGRHWPLLEASSPAKIVGCDISAQMLSELQKKFPRAEVHQINSEKIPFLNRQSIDLLFSTLTIGHLPKLFPYFQEWDRVLKTNAYVLITGNHPLALKQGVKRTFSVDGKSYSIYNIIHDFEDILENGRKLGWEKIKLVEKKIEGSHYPYFKAANAERSYRRVYGKPVIYGLLMQKR